ncbi:MAG: flagellar assembly protein FliX [Alphaproteobacteria bacterium]|nr:flagellar assembly protein FliX [Alphaproteobacteria bacterium]
MIDKIDGLGSVRSTTPIKRPAKTGAAGGTGFAKHLDESSEAGVAHGVAGSGAVSGILGIQEVDDALAHASKGKLRAQDILDRLEDLRIELLSGGISKEKLMQLSRIVNARRGQITDPKLSAILDEIDLRAQVELAKYSQQP